MSVCAPRAFNLINHLRSNHESSLNGIPIACTLLFRREYQKPYKKMPKKFQVKTRLNRFKKDRDDVYLMTQQAHPAHTPKDAIDMAKAYALFEPEQIRAYIQVNLGEGKTKVQNKEGLILLPHSYFKSRVLVLAEGEQAEEARAAGASVVGGRELFKQIEKGEVKYNHCIATPDIYPEVKYLARYMRESFPHPRRGTVTNDVTEVIRRLNSSKKFKLDSLKRCTLKLLVGWTDWKADEILDNFNAIVAALHEKKHVDVALNDYFLNASIKANSMPDARLDVGTFNIS